MRNINNYFLNTTADWKFIGEFERESVLDVSRNGIKTKANESLNWLVRKHFGNEWELIYKSYNSYWRTGSFYFVNKEMKKIIRISDHWSNSNSEAVKTVGSIRSCKWNLKVLKKDLNKVVGLKHRCKYYNYQAAVCSFSSFKANEAK